MKKSIIIVHSKVKTENGLKHCVSFFPEATGSLQRRPSDNNIDKKIKSPLKRGPNLKLQNLQFD